MHRMAESSPVVSHSLRTLSELKCCVPGADARAVSWEPFSEAVLEPVASSPPALCFCRICSAFPAPQPGGT